MSQVLGAFGLLDFTMLRPILAFSGCGKPRITESVDTRARLWFENILLPSSYLNAVLKNMLLYLHSKFR
jgi:hypothetical protein